MGDKYGKPERPNQKTKAAATYNVVFQDPFQRSVELWVYRIHIFQGKRLVKQLFVQRDCETVIDEEAVVNSQRYKPPNKPEVDQMFWVDRRVFVDFERVVAGITVFEEAVPWVWTCTGGRNER